MPCALDGDASIPLAQFGSSNVGRMKTIYRHGLGVRYGRIMQAISGVHFNYSFSARLWGVLADVNQSKQPRQSFVSEQYFGVLRNYRRYGWLVLYLFGTSPAVSKSFFAGRESHLAPARRGHLLRAVRHVSAHERHRISQQESSDGERVGQQPGGVRARPVAGDRLPPIRRTRKSASRSTANTCSSTPTSCRSRTNTTASSGRSGSRAPASGRPRHCSGPEWNTSKCARWT